MYKELNLANAFRLGVDARLALVGAGGKTTALFHTGRDLLSKPNVSITTVLVTTTTHLAFHQAGEADQHWIVHSPKEIERIADRLPTGLLLFSGPLLEKEGRWSSLADDALLALKRLADERQIPLLIEADGARQKPLKAPAAHEPAIPPWVNSVVVAAGLSGLNAPLDERTVHRADRFSKISGLLPGDILSPLALAKVLKDNDGGLKAIPPHARRLVMLNQADTPELQATARRLAELLLDSYHAVIITSLQPPQREPSSVLVVHERIAGIILAAGGSTRLGRPKQLLTWRGETFIHKVARTALEAGLSPVIVVIGAYGAQTRQAVSDLPVRIADNPRWQAGQSASLQAGLSLTSAESGGAVFFLVDQPQVPATLVRSLVERHSQTLSPIVAPLVDGQRGNPVLFDRQAFPDLLALSGDVGGKVLFSRYSISWVEWHDRDILLDVDTPADLKHLDQASQQD